MREAEISAAVYIAAHYGRRDEAKSLAAHLRRLGLTVTSTWHEGSATKRDHEMTTEERQALADTIVTELKTSDVLFYLSGPGGQGAGRFVEFGFALAWGIDIFVIGEREGVFCYATGVQQGTRTGDAIRLFLGPEYRELEPYYEPW